MTKRITIRDAGEVIGWVVEGGTWIDAPGHRSTDILLRGGTYEQIERFFYQRSQHRAPRDSEGRTYQDEYSFHFGEA
ncbi:MAG: hypothetical protein ACTIKT_14555 [Microbacterium sp.]